MQQIGKVHELNNSSQNYFRKCYLKYSKDCGKNLSDCTQLGCLQNVGFSCYLDSVLFALFAIHNDFIDENILFKKINKSTHLKISIIQKYLIAITRSIRLTKDITRCTGLRRIMKLCKMSGMPDFSTPTQQEAGEFLIYILTLFNADKFTKTRTITYGTNSLAKYVITKKLKKTSCVVDKESSIVIFLDSFLLRTKNKTSIHNLLIQRNDSGELDSNNLFKYNNTKFKRRIQITSVQDAPYLIFWAQRADPITESVLHTNIYPNKCITLPSNKTLYLNSIIIHIGYIDFGHYITYFRYKKSWYEYDDTNASIVKIGNYKSMLKYSPNPVTNGVLYFYSV